MSFNIRILARKGGPIVGDARIPPTRDNASGTTLAAGKKPPHPSVQQRAFLIMSAPHSEVTLGSEADTPGLDTTHLRPAEVSR